MIAGSISIEYVNGRVSTIPMTSPNPGMMETAMPIRSPIVSISRLYGTNTCASPTPRSVSIVSTNASQLFDAHRAHQHCRDLRERLDADRQRDVDDAHEQEHESEAGRHTHARGYKRSTVVAEIDERRDV